jgi:protein involved in polysaccharide export with SLBB domain
VRRVSQLGGKTSVVFALIALGALLVGCGTSEPPNSDAVPISAVEVPARAEAVPSASDDQRLEALWKQRTEETSGSDFHVGPGDVVGVSVPAIDQLKDLKVRVSASDTIALPMIGIIDVHGMTEQQVRDEISRRLEKYMYHPEVSVFGVEYQSREVAVVGAVMKPGVYTLASRSQTVLQMVSEAGMTSNAAQKLILIPHGLDREGEATRMLALAQAKDTGSVKPAALAQVDRDQAAQPDSSQGAEPVQDLKSSPSSGSLAPLLKTDAYVVIDLGGTSEQSHVDLPARPGDVIIIPESGNVMVQGWVANAGAYKISPGMTVLSAVAAAGGEMFSSSAEVFRTDNGEKLTIPVDLAKAKKGQGPDPAVQSGDVVIVDRSAVGAVPYAAYFIVNKFSTGIPIMW